MIFLANLQLQLSGSSYYYKLKIEMDKQGLFDDRFVLHIEDNEGKIVDVEI